MINIDYIGLKCGICGKDFEGNDDVVVCPDCGTPMHRVCYAQEKRCPNQDKHAQGYVFEQFEHISKAANSANVPLEPVKANAEDTKICPVCGEKNKSSAIYCNRCGINLNNAQSAAQNPANTQQIPNMSNMPNVPYMGAFDPLAGVPAAKEFEEGVTAADLACYVKVNTPYYMIAFDKIKNNLKSFNFSAALFSGVWFLYRKQYKVGSLLMSIEILLYALQFFFTYTYTSPMLNDILKTLGISQDAALTMEQYSKVGEYIFSMPTDKLLLILIPAFISILQFAWLIFWGFKGNKFYYKHCVEQVRKIKSNAKDEELSQEDTSMLLNAVGGVNTWVALAFFIMYVIYLFIPV